MIVILDGNSIAYRAYHKAPMLSASDGTPTGCVHIFFTILEKIKRELNPDEIIAVFDSHGETSRHKIYPNYKANRDAMPESLSTQMAIIKDMLPQAGIPLYAKIGIEADDIIATLAKNASGEVAIITKDKDLYQLVNDRIKIYDEQTGTLAGTKETLGKYGVLPNQMLDYLSLLGDKSDNIPGISGVGNKTAAKLISEYGSLDEIYNNIDKFKGKLKENLINEKDNAYTAKKLISLQEVELFAPEIREDKNALRERLSNLGMRNIAAKILQREEMNSQETTAIPFEFTPIIYGKVAEPVMFIALDEGLFVTDGKNYENFNPNTHKIKTESSFYNIKEFAGYIEDKNRNIKDYMLISWLCEPDNGTIKKSKNESIENFIPRLINLSKNLDDSLKKLKLDNLYTEVELKIAYILSEMELSGIKIAPSRVRDVANLLKNELAGLATKLILNAGYEFNLNSPKQLSEYLYDKLGIPQLSKTKRSTAEDVLKELMNSAPQHKDTLEQILTYRELSKLLSTYTQTLLDAKQEDGRIHTTFKQTGTATGRLSSTNPNLQNIPARGTIGKNIRNAFIPEEGYKFISIDYSQIELRILAHLSGDSALKEAFNTLQDIHTITAMKVFNINENEVTSDIRRLAKAVNFGILYGLSPYGLSRDTGITPKEAKSFIDAYFGLYSNVKGYIASVIEFTREHGYCETILGRKRFFPEINSRNALNRQRAERAAVNAPIQGSAADIIKKAMIDCNNFIKQSDYDLKLILQIHDELIFEAKYEHAEVSANELKQIMETAVILDVPLLVNAEIGDSWGDI